MTDLSTQPGFQTYTPQQARWTRIVIAGPEGSGKTTLAFSLRKILDPGSITLFDANFGADEQLSEASNSGINVVYYPVIIPEAVGVGASDSGKQTWSQMDQEQCMAVYTAYRRANRQALASDTKLIVHDTMSEIDVLTRAAHYGKLLGVPELYYNTVNFETEEDSKVSAPSRCGGKTVVWVHYTKQKYNSTEMEIKGHKVFEKAADIVIWCDKGTVDPMNPLSGENLSFRVRKFRKRQSLVNQVFKQYLPDGTPTGEFDLGKLITLAKAMPEVK